ncbi:hypothetical protein [Aliiruegeria lutimaris]|uniref:hypothetical protein n=1 Tax=Aliiruegeria lutimaris TaxID=571298 RepID=UPI00147D96E7|nr:hypothetical protein [Aliiruegeria lutimaris]
METDDILASVRRGLGDPHAVWLDDCREESNGCPAERLIGGALALPVSRAWRGH